MRSGVDDTLLAMAATNGERVTVLDKDGVEIMHGFLRKARGENDVIEGDHYELDITVDRSKRLRRADR